MNVARSRGTTFVIHDRTWEPDSIEDGHRANKALVDVAKALRYSGAAEYNKACLLRPAEVERRLKALTPRRRRAVNPTPRKAR